MPPSGYWSGRVRVEDFRRRSCRATLFINDPDENSSKRLKRITPMISRCSLRAARFFLALILDGSTLKSSFGSMVSRRIRIDGVA